MSSRPRRARTGQSVHDRGRPIRGFVAVSDRDWTSLGGRRRSGGVGDRRGTLSSIISRGLNRHRWCLPAWTPDDQPEIRGLFGPKKWPICGTLEEGGPLRTAKQRSLTRISRAVGTMHAGVEIWCSAQSGHTKRGRGRSRSAEVLRHSRRRLGRYTRPIAGTPVEAAHTAGKPSPHENDHSGKVRHAGLRTP